MNDDEIIKVLECCAVRGNCNGCPREKEWDKACAGIGIKDGLELIYRQKAKIENQREEIKRLRRCLNDTTQSRYYWKNKANRIGKQLQQVLEDMRKGYEWK